MLNGFECLINSNINNGLSCVNIVSVEKKE